ncbi:MAG: acetyl-CoA carboxylase biotin carboxyl carrier protein subunit [Bdellovibrionota bacterium]
MKQTYLQKEISISIDDERKQVLVDVEDQRFAFPYKKQNDQLWLFDGSTWIRASVFFTRQEKKYIRLPEKEIEILWKDPYALSSSGSGAAADAGDVRAVMPGRVVQVLVQLNQTIVQGQSLLILEAMKMENEVKAPCAGVVKKISVRPQDSVDAGQALIWIDHE